MLVIHWDGVGRDRQFLRNCQLASQPCGKLQVELATLSQRNESENKRGTPCIFLSPPHACLGVCVCVYTLWEDLLVECPVLSLLATLSTERE